MIEAKIKHLEFIQSTINRMANNSFLLKGWSVTLVGGLLALSFKEMNRFYVYVSIAILFFFWVLDGYYLARERLFIKLYDEVRIKVGETDFSMGTERLQKRGDWFNCAFSRTLILFYGGLLVVQLLIILII